SGTGSTCALTLTGNTTASVSVRPNTVSLGVTVTGQGGSVTDSTGAINCTSASGPCSTTYNYGTAVTLTANTPVGYTFVGWGGACTGTAATCSLTLTSNTTVSATFQVITQTLTVSIFGSGTVTDSLGRINCAGGTCTATYNYGTPVTIT